MISRYYLELFVYFSILFVVCYVLLSNVYWWWKKNIKYYCLNICSTLSQKHHSNIYYIYCNIMHDSTLVLFCINIPIY